MAKVKHKEAETSVGEEVDSIEWASEDIHEIADTGGRIVISSPPSTYHKIYNIYAQKIGTKYHLVMVVETEPEE